MGELKAGDVTVVFRCDDYSAVSNTALEVRLIEAFRQRDIPLVFAVIPCIGASDSQEGSTLSDEKAAILREASGTGTVDVVLHGYSHQKTGPWTEFAGLSYDEQVRRLERGLTLLRDAVGVHVTTFVPPYNAYDEATLRAMQDLGFTCLSAGKTGCIGEYSLSFLPSTCGLADARQTIESAMQASSSRVIVILFHVYDFLDADRYRGFLSWPAFEQFVDWVLSQEQVNVRSLAEVVNSDTDLSRQRFVANRRLSRHPDYVPPFLIQLFGTETHAYLSTGEAHNLQRVKAGLYAATAGFYAVLAAAGAAMAIVLRKRARPSLIPLLRYTGLAVLAIIVVYGGRNLTFGYRCALLSSAMAGVCLGLCMPKSRRADPATS